jgi:hypothetical protein
MAREYIPVELRRLVIDRAAGACEYCRFPVRFALESMEFDHIQPLSLGGRTESENLAYACHSCNQCKHSRVEGFDSASSSNAPLYNPRTMVWKNHFSWSEDTTLIIGRTPTGRVTVCLLRLNRSSVINLRTVLRGSGDHPPD